MSIQRQCEFCGKKFAFTASRGAGRFCSRRCLFDFNRPASRQCNVCGISFTPGSKSQRYCSIGCAGAAKTNRREDMWKYVQIGSEDECWPWQAGLSRTDGYGSFCVGYKGLAAHRLAYELTKGPIPNGLVVRHTCDNPPCCNPAHLLIGTVADNNWDKVERGRAGNPGLGSAHFAAKLTETQVREIRARRAAGERNGALADEFKVSPPTISRITRGYGWVHVEVTA